MTNEAVPITLLGNKGTGDVVRFTVAAGTAVSAGTIMHLLDPVTAVKTAGAAGEAAGTHYFAGIAATDKDSSDPSTTLGLWTNGIFDIRAAGSENISAGQLVKISGANTVALMDVDVGESQGIIVGKALEDVASGTAETIAVLVGAR